ncbi:beta-mannosidase [Chitinophaga flava]|uniref:Beta-mannosidase B n=1 Tax=Chitinophaga flava TaxID=2259036 RepID=A0A365Y259_9BACT|nr:glycoside hydrolase family 2 protein [Chitinophaga flava]RBL92712.1 glycoside hydrolase [Chitinophaga flava]
MKYNRWGRWLISIFFLTCFTKSIYAAEIVADTLVSGWEFSRVDEGIWRPATVPGTVHTDLLALQLIPDPFVGTNEKAVQWVDKKDWQYRKRWKLTASDLQYDVLELDFKGLDTYASVYVNGHLVLQSANMFVEQVVNVKQWLHEGENELRVLFESPIKHDMPQFLKDQVIYPAGNDASDIPLSVYARKAPYHYGWDWGPRLVTAGIWKPVYLKKWNKAIIRDIWWQQQQLDAAKAAINAVLTLETVTAGTYSLKLSAALPGAGQQTITKVVTLQKGTNTIQVPVQIKQPKLWWPAGLGDPTRYTMSAQLVDKNTVLATDQQLIGLRTIEVVNKPDSLGESFYVKVNGRAVFMKGANYIPQDNFLPRVSEKKYRQLFEDMQSSHFNMVRVWGGGVYEDDQFYALADASGILVWQDFMFACTLYPSDTAFLANVRQEAAYTIKRLRNHPSLALWCGNNEVAVAIKNWGWQSGYAYTDAQWASLQQGYDQLFKELLPTVVKENDPGRFYFHSSPISNWGKKEDFTKGDNHYWGVWHGMEWFEAFNTHIPRFMSEYGFQSFPEMATIDSFATKADYDIFSNVMQAHQKSPAKGNTAIKTYMLHYYHAPKDFPSFVYLSQVLQAEGMKVAIEAHRRAMPYCMGTLYWQLNDCWPGPSWSGRDYYGRWKALQYYVKDAFTPLLVSGLVENKQLGIWLVSDENKDQKGDLELIATNLSGHPLWQQTLKNITIKANTSNKVIAVDTAAILKGRNPAEVICYAQLRIDNKIIKRNIFYFVPAKEMALEEPSVAVTFGKQPAQDNVVYMTVKAEKLARNVYLQLDDATPEERFEENYFDLLPGENKTIRIYTKRNPVAIRAALKVTSLVDTYKN